MPPTSPPHSPRPPGPPGPPRPTPTTAWIASALHSTDWVDATPFRAHLHYLVGTSGLHGRVIAQFCGIPTQLADRLLVLGDGTRGSGRPGEPLRRARRISHYCAARLLNVRPADLDATRCVTVPAEPTLHRLDALVAAGVGLSAAAATVGASATEFDQLRRHRWSRCPQLLALQVAAAVQALAGDEPGVEPGEDVPTLRIDRAG